MKFPFYIYIIFFSVACCYFNMKNLHPRFLKRMLFFLIYTAATEVGGYWMKFNHIHNHWLYNIFILVEFYFWFYIYYYAISERRIKKGIQVVSVVFGCYALVNLFFIQHLHTFNTYTYIPGAILVIVLSILYFRQLLINESMLRLASNTLFWISTALLLYYLGNLPFYGMINFLNAHYAGIASKYFPILVHVLLITKHLLFSIGFLCSIPNQKSK